MAGRFEPTKSGEYLTEYKDEKGSYVKEKLYYNRKNNTWSGSRDSEFYKEHVVSWYYNDILT